MNPFYHIIDEARAWVGPTWKFTELSDIRWCSDRARGGLWFPPGADGLARIECGWEETIGLLWHEVFHSVFHGSPLSKFDPAWGEGWCNAFSDVHHREFKPVSFAIMSAPKTLHEKRYLVPAQILLTQAGYDKERLRQLWLHWNRREATPGSFSGVMGYTPE